MTSEGTRRGIDEFFNFFEWCAGKARLFGSNTVLLRVAVGNCNTMTTPAIDCGDRGRHFQNVLPGRLEKASRLRNSD